MLLPFLICLIPRPYSVNKVNELSSLSETEMIMKSQGYLQNEIMTPVLTQGLRGSLVLDQIRSGQILFPFKPRSNSVFRKISGGSKITHQGHWMAGGRPIFRFCTHHHSSPHKTKRQLGQVIRSQILMSVSVCGPRNGHLQFPVISLFVQANLG